MEKQKAIDFFSELFYGEHHIPGDLKPFGNGYYVLSNASEFSTYDFNQLTRIVFLAHDRCIRVQIEPCNFQKMKIIVHERKTREGGMTERHPTIETALKQWREQHPIEQVV